MVSKHVLNFLCIANLCSFFTLYLASEESNGVIKTNQNYYYVGENITLHCFANTKFVDLKFTYGNDIEVPMEYVTVINDTYARMDRPAMAEDYLKLNYICWNNFSNSNHVAAQTIETEYSPKNVTALTCIYFNYLDVLCTWNHSTHYKLKDAVTVTAEMSTDGKTWKICTTSASNCSFPNYTEPFLDFRVNVSNVRRRDRVSNSLLRITLEDHVKTSPVSNLTAKSVNSTCVHLTWDTPHQTVSFNVTYSPNIVSPDHKSVSTDEKNTTVCGLRPFTIYTFGVRTLPKKMGFFSDVHEVVVQTKEDAPRTGPLITKGSYYRSECQPETSANGPVNIYFQPVEEEDKNGIITNFSAIVVMEETSQREYHQRPNLFFFTIAIPCDKDANVSLYASTSAGQSPPSSIYVPAGRATDIQNMSAKMDFTFKEVKAGSMVASWKSPEDHNPYTVYVFYCKKTSTPKICTGPMKYKIENASTGQLQWNSGDADLFGFSLESSNEASGIYFTDCVYNPRGEERFIPEKPSIGPLTASKVRIQWEYKYCDQSRKVMTYGYQIKICRVDHPNDCSIYNITRSDIKHIDITDLRNGLNYSATVLANTTSGLTESSNPEFFYIPVDSFPISTETIVIISTVCGTVVAIVITFYCCVREKLRKAIRRFNQTGYPIPATVGKKNLQIHPLTPEDCCQPQSATPKPAEEINTKDLPIGEFSERKPEFYRGIIQALNLNIPDKSLISPNECESGYFGSPTSLLGISFKPGDLEKANGGLPAPVEDGNCTTLDEDPQNRDTIILQSPYVFQHDKPADQQSRRTDSQLEIPATQGVGSYICATIETDICPTHTADRNVGSYGCNESNNGSTNICSLKSGKNESSVVNDSGLLHGVDPNINHISKGYNSSSTNALHHVESDNSNLDTGCLPTPSFDLIPDVDINKYQQQPDSGTNTSSYLTHSFPLGKNHLNTGYITIKHLATDNDRTRPDYATSPLTDVSHAVDTVHLNPDYVINALSDHAQVGDSDKSLLHPDYVINALSNCEQGNDSDKSLLNPDYVINALSDHAQVGDSDKSRLHPDYVINALPNCEQGNDSDKSLFNPDYVINALPNCEQGNDSDKSLLHPDYVINALPNCEQGNDSDKSLLNPDYVINAISDCVHGAHSDKI